MGKDVVNNGNVSPLFSSSNPIYHHLTFDVGKEDTDYFYISGTDDFVPKVLDIDLTQNVNNFIVTAYRIQPEKKESVVSLIYLCNPLFPVNVYFKMTIVIENCG